jgi:aminoglycoside/choline kinase family phosphotransferase
VRRFSPLMTRIGERGLKLSERAHLIDEFLARHDWAGAGRQALPGDASFRRYHRVSHPSHGPAMLMDAPPPQEDVRPFLSLARHLLDLGLSAPKIFAADEERGFLLLEDFGDDTYTRLLAKGANERELYELAVDVLIKLHGHAKAVPTGLPPYDAERLLTEASLLTDWYMPEILGQAPPEAARAAYIAIWKNLLPLAYAAPHSLVLRDYHVDNLMRLAGRQGVAACGLLDFQDAVAGPVTYDLMSLLEDARRDIDPGLIAAMRSRYLAAFPDLDQKSFAASFAVLAAQRHCKVIGIFTRLMRRDGKPVYLSHIPRLWRLLENSLAHPALEPLAVWLDEHLPAAKRIIPSC